MKVSDAVREYLARVARLEVGELMGWRPWCDAHRDELQQALGRKGFSTLKFSPEESVPPLLESMHIAFEPGPLRELLRDAALGARWNAEPADTFGVRALYAEGRDPDADAIIARAVASIAADEANHARERELGEMVMGAEWLQRKGERRYALGIAKAIAALDRDDDLVAAAIDHARELLRKL